jgi:hypothetical protein
VTKDVRCKKARTNGVMSGCGHHVLVGQWIVKVGDVWLCMPCRKAQIGVAA